MKPYAKTRKCHCGGYESCNLCRPQAHKKKSRRAERRRLKKLTNKEDFLEQVKKDS